MRYWRTKILSKARLIRYVNLVETLRWSGQSFRIPVLGGVGMANVFDLERYQADVISQLRRWAERGFVDVGVNVGQTLLYVPRSEAGFKRRRCCPGTSSTSRYWNSGGRLTCLTSRHRNVAQPENGKAIRFTGSLEGLPVVVPG